MKLQNNNAVALQLLRLGSAAIVVLLINLGKSDSGMDSVWSRLAYYIRRSDQHYFLPVIKKTISNKKLFDAKTIIWYFP